MVRGSRMLMGIAASIAIFAGEAHAQYYPGYGGYGWGGWGGGGATPQGDYARGLGAYNIGAGEYNEMTAEAASINTDTVVRWNQYLWSSQQEANRREYLRMAQRQQAINQTSDQLYQRLRDNPTDADINDGNALNLVLDQITDPRIHSSAIRMANDPIAGSIIDDIPFENASDSVTLSLHQLTSKDNWPLALQDDAFQPERKAWEAAIAQVLKEDENGRIQAKTLATLRAIPLRIHDKLEASPPADKLALSEGRNYVKTMAGLARMLENPRVEKAIAALEKHPQTTLGGLLGFMHTYNLRFAPATTPEQRAIYADLYPKLVSHRDRVVKDSGIDTSQPAPKPKGNPTDFFQGMNMNHLGGKDQ
ncbi:hypothetical protein ACYOEI_05265 [Singulisphaera rosea]